MARALTIQNLLDTKHETFAFDGIWKDVFGEPEKGGVWLMWGNEKNGKTWFALLFAAYLSRFEKVRYVSAEEGIGKDFKEACIRAKIDPKNKNLHIDRYIPIEELSENLKKRKAPRIIFIDNITIYADELKNGVFRKLIKDHPKVDFLFLAHEERGEPYTATAKLCRKLAKRIVYVQGLTCMVSGRGPGGTLVIDEEKAALYHGTQQKTA